MQTVCKYWQNINVHGNFPAYSCAFTNIVLRCVFPVDIHRISAAMANNYIKAMNARY